MAHESDEEEEAPPRTLSGKTVAGRYAVIGVLGQGGSGRVYSARQEGLDRKVAIKVLRKDRKQDPVTVQRFMREARAAGRIASPHVVTLFDFGRDDDELYIAMELLEGLSLSQRLSKGPPFGLPEAIHVATSVTKGLRAAHEAGVLHRDLKPGNVFLCADGTVKVLDFGIAKLLDDENDWEPLTAVNRIVGTPVYMSPEAATRRPLGPTTDLYAVGLILYEMIVGEPPFKTGNAMKTLQAQVMEPAPRLRVAAPWLPIPAPLDDLVHELLQKDPSARPRDAGEVAERLERIGKRLARSAETAQQERTAIDIAAPDDAMDPGEVTAEKTEEQPSPPDPLSDETEVWSGKPWLDEYRASQSVDLADESLDTTTPEPVSEEVQELRVSHSQEGPSPAFAPAPAAPAAAPSPTPRRGPGVALLVLASLATGCLAFGVILLLRLWL